MIGVSFRQSYVHVPSRGWFELKRGKLIRFCHIQLEVLSQGFRCDAFDTYKLQ